MDKTQRKKIIDAAKDEVSRTLSSTLLTAILAKEETGIEEKDFEETFDKGLYASFVFQPLLRSASADSFAESLEESALFDEGTIGLLWSFSLSGEETEEDLLSWIDRAYRLLYFLDDLANGLIQYGRAFYEVEDVEAGNAFFDAPADRKALWKECKSLSRNRDDDTDERRGLKKKVRSYLAQRSKEEKDNGNE